MNYIAKLVFTGDKRQLEMIKQRTRSIVAVHKIKVEFSDLKSKEAKKSEAKQEVIAKDGDKGKKKKNFLGL